MLVNYRVQPQFIAVHLHRCILFKLPGFTIHKKILRLAFTFITKNNHMKYEQKQLFATSSAFFFWPSLFSRKGIGSNKEITGTVSDGNGAPSSAFL